MQLWNGVRSHGRLPEERARGGPRAEIAHVLRTHAVAHQAHSRIHVLALLLHLVLVQVIAAERHVGLVVVPRRAPLVVAGRLGRRTVTLAQAVAALGTAEEGLVLVRDENFVRHRLPPPAPLALQELLLAQSHAFRQDAVVLVVPSALQLVEYSLVERSCFHAVPVGIAIVCLLLLLGAVHLLRLRVLHVAHERRVTAPRLAAVRPNGALELHHARAQQEAVGQGPDGLRVVLALLL